MKFSTWYPDVLICYTTYIICHLTLVMFLHYLTLHKGETRRWRLTLRTVFLRASLTKPLTSGKHGWVHVWRQRDVTSNTYCVFLVSEVALFRATLDTKDIRGTPHWDEDNISFQFSCVMSSSVETTREMWQIIYASGYHVLNFHCNRLTTVQDIHFIQSWFLPLSNCEGFGICCLPIKQGWVRGQHVRGQGQTT